MLTNDSTNKYNKNNSDNLVTSLTDDINIEDDPQEYVIRK